MKIAIDVAVKEWQETLKQVVGKMHRSENWAVPPEIQVEAVGVRA